MKDVTFTVEFTQHVLANGQDSEGNRDHFQRDNNDNLIFQQSWWYSAFLTALKMERIKHIKPGDIYMDLVVDAPTEMYRRRYGQNKSRMHEAIMPGTEVEFNAVVEDRVTESTLTRILERVGRYIGLSPYGHKLGYGHFHLLDLEMSASEAATGDEDVKVEQIITES